MFWYRTQTICVKWGKLCSSYFSVNNGVRQGGILSPKLFSVYADDLSVALSATKTGCVINDKSVNLVFYADDLCIMSASPAGLQKLIDICYNYSVHNSLTFNPTKSVCVVFKPKKFKLYCPPMVLNAAPLPYVDSVNPRRPKHRNIAHKKYFSENSIYFRYPYELKNFFFVPPNS